jgi:hypothetical protein
MSNRQVEDTFADTVDDADLAALNAHLNMRARGVPPPQALKDKGDEDGMIVDSVTLPLTMALLGSDSRIKILLSMRVHADEALRVSSLRFAGLVRSDSAVSVSMILVFLGFTGRCVRSRETCW